MAAQSRIQTAINDALLTLPDGNVHVMRPEPGFDVSSFDGRQIDISHTFEPTVRAWERSGYEVHQTHVEASVVCVVAPRSKSLAKSMIAKAAGSGDLILVDGQKTDGIDSLFKSVRKEIGAVPSVTKAHGRLFWFNGTEALAEWILPAQTKGADGYYTAPGAFSDGMIDKGSALLADALPALKGRIADFGAGWGYLSEQVLAHEAVTSVDLIEAEALALDCAKLNISAERAVFHWADAVNFRAQDRFDAIVMNPPFHQGRTGEPSLGRDFITSAAKNLKPSGDLWMVANRHLPYEAHLRDTFRHVEELSGDAAFKIFHASRPAG